MADIDITPRQAQSVADLARATGTVALHQLVADERTPIERDVYATPHGSRTGYRITSDGAVTPIGETLPAAG